MSIEPEPQKTANKTLKEGLRLLQKKRSGFRQKAEPFNLQTFPALCRDAATADGRFCKGLGL
jgi:hypothetical protein